MAWMIIGVCAALIMFAAAAAGAFGIFDSGMSQPEAALPSQDASAADIAQMRFSPAVGGYRRDQVDRAIEILVARIEELEEADGVSSEQ
ncbi:MULTISPECIES: DivIVA domain-containing protein [unclassified Brevibacterium]|uniref:DivIVA domain-containing protein n=1 Tax=unclassified Brevibacterium TaxID=2614124 RepID=UPI0008A4BD4F|nr:MULTISPECIES: DivIVA domain-containing protein [unclassified Brevibacterium]OFL65246.1 hypothetical protein HMPREF2757_05065 [Brevibacterium sp. HMSC063G07]OFS25169.1 hypothetical protein HMPREF3162_09645 [Brevibacterium sp. HMSC07C04]